MRLSLALGAALALASPAPAQDLNPVATLEWQSSGISGTDLALDIERLYLTLYNSGNMVLRSVNNADGKFIENLMRDEGVYLGAYFPVSLDAMICDLNPDICTRDRQPADAKTLSNISAHVGGYLPSQGRWRKLAGQDVWLPDYRFEPFTTLDRVRVDTGWSPESFEPTDAMDCSQWGMSCLDVVRQFNPRHIKAPDIASAVLPNLRVETMIPLRPDTSSSFSETLFSLGSAQEATSKTRTFVDTMPEFSNDWTQYLAGNSPTDLAVDQIRGNLTPLGQITKYGLQDEELIAQQVDLFKLIHHPFGEFKGLPEAFDRPVGVLIIDSKLSEGHCDLPDFGLPVFETPVAVEESTVADNEVVVIVDDVTSDAVEHGTPDCAGIDNLAISDTDHVAHVAGLIASQENGKGIVGMNPSAKISFLEFDRNQASDLQLSTLAIQMLTAIPDGDRVVNLSFGAVPSVGGPDAMRRAVDVQAGRILLVAAAGNSALELGSSNCPILPACLNDLENVITVVGLDRDLGSPGPWITQGGGTNTNPNFDIGAVAEKVLSTVSHNKFGYMSGTSQAAPQVSATASLIFAAGEFIYGDALAGGQLAPKVVKDRLIYTADFFPSLGGIVHSGRLNVERAINLSVAQFELFDGRRISGQVIKAPTEFTCNTPNAEEQFQRWWTIRRLTFNDERGRHIIFRHVGPDGDRYGPLHRYASCVVTTRSAPVEVLTREGAAPQVVAFTFGDIRDYTAPLFDE